MSAREDDIEVLGALCAYTEEVGVDGDSSLSDAEAVAFADMLRALEDGQPELTEKQRRWSVEAADRLGVLYGDPAKRNAGVPRGRPVEMAEVLKTRPLKPPTRRTT